MIKPVNPLPPLLPSDLAPTEAMPTNPPFAPLPALGKGGYIFVSGEGAGGKVLGVGQTPGGKKT